MSKRLNLYIDGVKIPKRSISRIYTTEQGILVVETINRKTKEKIITNAALRKIELR